MDLQNSKIAIRRAGAADCAVIYRLICALEDETLPQARFEGRFLPGSWPKRTGMSVCWASRAAKRSA